MHPESEFIHTEEKIIQETPKIIRNLQKILKSGMLSHARKSFIIHLDVNGEIRLIARNDVETITLYKD